MSGMTGTILCLDSSVTGDLLEEREYVVEFVRSRPPETRVAVPAVVRYELYWGALRSDREDLTVSRLGYYLDFFEHVGFGDAQAREAAEVRATLLDEGLELGGPDFLIAGSARSIGAELVTGDGDFRRVPDLTVHVVRPGD